MTNIYSRSFAQGLVLSLALVLAGWLSSTANAADTVAPAAAVAPVVSSAPSSHESEEAKANRTKVTEEQKLAADAKAAKDEAQKKRDALAAQQASKPSPDIERKIKDADYEVMMADAKLSSATKSLERAQKKLDESLAREKPLQPSPAVAAEKSVSTEVVDQAKIKAAQEAAKKAAEEKARKDEEARIAQQKAAEEQTKKAAEELAKKAEAEAAAKKQALAAELGIDLNNCKALPTTSSNSATSLSAADLQQQAYAQGELRRINRLIGEKAIDDVPPVTPFPMLEGSLLKPCDANQKQALKFGYMGSGQYQLETRVLAGEQSFSVKNVIEPVQRTIPEADNGEVYIFFLDLKFPGRYKLMAYKKSLFDQEPAQ